MQDNVYCMEIVDNKYLRVTITPL